MKKFLLGMCLSASCLPAFAESDFSVGLLLGSAKQETSSDGARDLSGSDLSIGVRAAYHINEYFAVEAGYHDYGEAEDSFVDSFDDNIGVTIGTTALTLGLKGSLPFDNGFALSARAGVASWEWDLAVRDSAFPGEVFKSDDDGTDLYYGVGAEYTINSQVSLGVEYTVTDMDVRSGVADIDHEVNNFSLSLNYSFN